MQIGNYVSINNQSVANLLPPQPLILSCTYASAQQKNNYTKTRLNC